MAKVNKPLPEVEPLAELTKDTLEHIDAIGAELDKATEDLDALETLGIDASRLREKIAWGRKAREVILKQFGPKT